MNANQLADELDTMLKAIGLIDNRVPTMLRQQQAEIEALLKFIDERGETGQLIIWKAQEK